MAICNKTGCIAIYNESKNIFLSPMADGPLKFVSNVDDNMNIVNVSKYGRDFCIVKVPYAFKLLNQELHHEDSLNLVVKKKVYNYKVTGRYE